MRRRPFDKGLYAWRYNMRRNFKEDKMETNSKVVRRKRCSKFQSWADGYAPIGLVQNKRKRSDRYKDRRKK